MTVAAGTGGPSLSARFVTVARKASSGQGAGSVGLVYTALSLAASLRAGGKEDRRELTGLFLSTLSAAASSAIRPPSQVRMARPFLASVPQSAFDGELAPALGLKLRAHPDKFLPVIEVVLSSIARGEEGVDASSQLTEGAGLLPSITKHLRLGRAETRGCAWRSLVLLARLSGRDSLSSAETVAEAVCAMLSAAGLSGLAPANRRAARYAALGGVAEAVLVGRDNGAGAARTGRCRRSRRASPGTGRGLMLRGWIGQARALGKRGSSPC